MKRSVGSTCRPSSPDAFYRISFVPLTHNSGGRGASLLSGHGQTSLNLRLIRQVKADRDDGAAASKTNRSLHNIFSLFCKLDMQCQKLTCLEKNSEHCIY